MKILVSAIELSANFYLKEILSRSRGDLLLYGIFSKELGKPIYDYKEFAIIGLVDVFKKLFKLKSALNKLVKLSSSCDKVLLIDGSSFNLRLAKMIKKRNPNIEIIYFILPKVWAWKKNRAKAINKYIDYPISIFPFEDRYFTNSKYFGNPLIYEVDKFKGEVSSSGDIALLAGSRKGEVTTLMPIYRELKKSYKDKNFKIVIPSSFNDEYIDELYGNLSGFTIVRSIYELDNICCAVVCSGTASLELALIGVPSIIVYKLKSLDAFLAPFFIKVKYIGLANLVLDFSGYKTIQKELINDVTIEKIKCYLGDLDIKEFNKKQKILNSLLKGDTYLGIIDIIYS